MTARNKRKAIWLATIAAVAVFAASAFAAGANVSGYERLKSAGFEMIERFGRAEAFGVGANGTYRVTTSLSMDGVELMGSEGVSMLDSGRTLIWEKSRNNVFQSFEPFERDSDESVTYRDRDVSYHWYGDGKFYEFSSRGRYYDMSFGGDGMVVPPAQRRFIEALMDTLVGDTRNYFVTDGDRVSITLSGNQIPELAQVALAAIAERASDEINSSVFFSDTFALGVDARFSHASLVVDLGEDSDGASTINGASMAIEIESTVNGAARVCWFAVEYDSFDIGTTRVSKPEPSAEGKPAMPSFAGGAAAADADADA